MKNILSSEFRKLLTVRSTYVITVLACLLTLFMSFFIEGYKGLNVPPGGYTTHKLTELVFNTPFVAGQFGVIVAILLMIHEYRHNTITYTLTAANSRLKVLIAKIIVISVYGAILAVLLAGLSIGGFHVGLAMRGVSLVPQQFALISVFARCVFYAVGFILFGLAVAVLVRNIAFAIVIMFMAPGTIEPLLGFLLKDNAAYLPFTLLGKVVATTSQANVPGKEVEPLRAAFLFTLYLILFWIITAWVFERRDAS